MKEKNQLQRFKTTIECDKINQINLDLNNIKFIKSQNPSNMNTYKHTRNVKIKQPISNYSKLCNSNTPKSNLNKLN